MPAGVWLILVFIVPQGINPFESDTQAEDLYDEKKPHLFIEIAPQTYMLQGISGGEHNFLHSSSNFRSDYTLIFDQSLIRDASVIHG